MSRGESDSLTLDSSAGLAQLRLIAVALCAGAAIFAVIASFVAPVTAGGAAGGSASGPAAVGTTLDLFNILRLAWLGLAVTELPVLMFIRQAMLNRAVAAHRGAPVVGPDEATARTTFVAFQGWTLIALAIAESLALFACVIYLLSGNPIDLALVGAGLAAMMVLFPGVPRWESFQRRVTERAALAR